MDVNTLTTGLYWARLKGNLAKGFPRTRLVQVTGAAPFLRVYVHDTLRLDKPQALLDPVKDVEFLGPVIGPDQADSAA